MSTASPVKPDDDSAPVATTKTQADPQTSPATESPTSAGLHPDIRRTVMYIAGAAVFLAITGLFEFANRPAAIEDFGKVGQEFYADFTDPTLATSLEVYVFDADNVKLRDFHVERLDNGRWVIPSHHNYPADAEDQLAETASSIIGIKRGAMVTRWEADHARYGVVNPKQKSLNVGEVEGVGSRVILRGDDDTVLADYVIGNKVDGEFDQYYVRHPEEDDVYIAELDIDLSTKFTDWIDTDLLEVDRDDIVAMTLNDYSFDELQGRVTGRDISTLTREKYSDPWQLEGLNEDTEEIDKDKLRDMVSAIADFEIAGVRPKQQGLTPELTLDRSVIKSQKDVDRVQTDLLTRGFALQPVEGEEGRLRLIAREGELSAATKDGLVYHLHFGRVFTGSQEELETGFATSSESDSAEVNDESSADADNSEADAPAEEDSTEHEATDVSSDEDVSNDDSSDDAEANDDESDAEDESSSTKPGRYAFVRVDFDVTYLGEEPVKPTEPEKPAELIAAESEADSEDSTDESASDDSEPKAEASDDEESDESEEDPLAEIRKEYEEAKSKYDSDLTEYERKKKEHDEKIEEGKKKAEELNRRFAEWYYVIPGDDFEDITLARADIVKEKKTDEETASDEPAEASTDEAASDAELNSDDSAVDSDETASTGESGQSTQSTSLSKNSSDEETGSTESEDVDASANSDDLPITEPESELD